jgi:hypothetical protein
MPTVQQPVFLHQLCSRLCLAAHQLLLLLLLLACLLLPCLLHVLRLPLLMTTTAGGAAPHTLLGRPAGLPPPGKDVGGVCRPPSIGWSTQTAFQWFLELHQQGFQHLLLYEELQILQVLLLLPAAHQLPLLLLLSCLLLLLLLD